MTGENAAEVHSPSRRALLKAAAAGGAFAVPLIASFSMDTASAQTSSATVFSSNMFCSNMTGVPTAVFYAQLAPPSGGPVAGLAGFEFVHGRNQLFYELLVKGTPDEFGVIGPAGPGEYFFEVRGSSKFATIAGSALACGNFSGGTFPEGASLRALYDGMASGQWFIDLFLTDGSELLGTIVRLGRAGAARNGFRFVGRH